MDRKQVAILQYKYEDDIAAVLAVGYVVAECSVVSVGAHIAVPAFGPVDNLLSAHHRRVTTMDRQLVGQLFVRVASKSLLVFNLVPDVVRYTGLIATPPAFPLVALAEEEDAVSRPPYVVVDDIHFIKPCD